MVNKKLLKTKNQNIVLQEIIGRWKKNMNVVLNMANNVQNLLKKIVYTFKIILNGLKKRDNIVVLTTTYVQTKLKTMIMFLVSLVLTKKELIK